jgi:hypothetical protein
MVGSDRCVSHLRIAHRKTTLTPQLGERLALMLRSGVPLATAAAAVNVSRATLYRWLARPEPLYVAFREQIEKARAQGEVALVHQIVRESEERWESAASLLERLDPEQFGPPGDRSGGGEPPDPFAEFAAAFQDDAPE